MGWRIAAIAGGFFGLLALAQCNEHSADSVPDAQTVADASQDVPPPIDPNTIDAGATPVVACGASTAEAGSDAATDADADMDATPANPGIFVDEAGGECGFPPSVCADGHWLVYYKYGTCMNGFCAWAKDYVYCPDGCSSGFFGSCQVSITAGVGPPAHT